MYETYLLNLSNLETNIFTKIYSQTIDNHFCLKTSEEHLLFNATIETNKVSKYSIINITFNKLSVIYKEKTKKKCFGRVTCSAMSIIHQQQFF